MDRGCRQSSVCWVKWQEIIWAAAVIRSAPILYSFNASDLILSSTVNIGLCLLNGKEERFPTILCREMYSKLRTVLCIFFKNHKPTCPVPTLRPDSHPQQLPNGASWVAHQLNWLCTCRQLAELLCANNRELRRETSWLKKKKRLPKS